MPVLPLIGNHDNRPALHAALPPPAPAMVDYQQFRRDIGNLTVLCLDTHIPGDDAGALDDARLDWLDEQLAATAERQVLVFMHHPPGPLGLALLDDMPLRDAEPLITRLAAAPQVAHLLCGHVHRPVSGTIGGVPFTTLRALAHQTRPPHLLKNWSDFVARDERPQYGVILTAPDRVVVQALDLEGAI
jgi:3',5'-cyclic AMP phosphodiesterase CpdA